MRKEKLHGPIQTVPPNTPIRIPPPPEGSGTERFIKVVNKCEKMWKVWTKLFDLVTRSNESATQWSYSLYPSYALSPLLGPPLEVWSEWWWISVKRKPSCVWTRLMDNGPESALVSRSLIRLGKVKCLITNKAISPQIQTRAASSQTTAPPTAEEVLGATFLGRTILSGVAYLSHSGCCANHHRGQHQIPLTQTQSTTNATHALIMWH